MNNLYLNNMLCSSIQVHLPSDLTIRVDHTQQ